MVEDELGEEEEEQEKEDSDQQEVESQHGHPELHPFQRHHSYDLSHDEDVRQHLSVHNVFADQLQHGQKLVSHGLHNGLPVLPPFPILLPATHQAQGIPVMSQHHMQQQHMHAQAMAPQHLAGHMQPTHLQQHQIMQGMQGR